MLSLLLGLIREEPPAAAKRLLPEIDGVLAGLHGYSAVLRREPEGFSLETHSDLGTIGTGLAAAIIEDQTRPIIVRRVQADFDQIAAALEKYREKTNAYPATLQALVPDYVPELRNDRFAPKLPYGYTCGRADAAGRMPDAWLLVSVGPDDRPNLPLDQFDPPAWAARLRSEKPEDVALLKTLIYQFRKDLYSDERKNDDEGDLFRMGGRGLGPEPAPAPAPTTEPLRP